MRELVPESFVLGGRFRLVRQIGEGGMGVVWEATEVASGNRFAIKFLRDTARNPDLEKRFFREAEAANAVHHPCILHVHQILHDDEGAPAFVMDLLEGEPLSARIEREGRLSVGQTAAILVPALQALQAAHLAGVVHRDLKPDNIFVTKESDGRVGVRVLDFGIARLTRPSEKLTVTGTLMGTPLYMSPEQAGGESVDARTDVWSMGALAFECLTGTTPVSGDNYGQILSRLIRREVKTLGTTQNQLPPDVVQAIDALFVERDRRAPDLGVLERALAPYADKTIADPPAFVPAAEPSARMYAANGATMLDASAPVTPPARATPIIAVGLGLLMFVGVAAGTAALLVRSRHARTPATALTTAVEPPAIASSAPPPPALPAAETVAPSAAPSIAPSAAPSAAPSIALNPASGTRRPTPSARPVASAAPTAPTGPKKLSGGVADGPGF